MLTESHHKTSSSRHPRVAVITHWFPKPSETFIYDELSALAGLGVPLSIFTLYGPWRGQVSPDMPDTFCPVSRLGSRSLGVVLKDVFRERRLNAPAARELWRQVPVRRWSDWEMAGENLWAFLCGFSLARYVREGRFDFIYAPWGNGPATAAWTASRLTGVPFGFSTYAGDIFPPDGALAEKIKDCQFVRSTSRTFLPHLQKHAGDQAGKLHALYSGLDPRRFARVTAPLGQPLRLLALGRFVAKKGFDVLIHACAILKRDGFDFHLDLVGGGAQSFRLRRLARKLDLGDQVSFPGFVQRSKTVEVFHKADLFVMPSVVDSAGDRDGIPTVILEALLCGLPVVATDAGAIREVIRDGITGCLLQPGDPVGLAGAVRWLTENSEEAKAMAEQGREFVLKEFDLETNARKLLELIVTGAEKRNG